MLISRAIYIENENVNLDKGAPETASNSFGLPTSILTRYLQFMKGKGIIHIILFSWILPAVSQRGYDLTRYVYESEYIVCGKIVSADTLDLVSMDPTKSQSVITKMKVLSKLKGVIPGDTIKIQYFPIDYWEHEDPPALQVDSSYLGFMKYNSQFDYFEPVLYDRLCFSLINQKQNKVYNLIINGLLDSTLDSCKFFKLIMEGVNSNLLLINRTLNDILNDTSDPQITYCIDESTIDYLYGSFCHTKNTRLLNFIGYHYSKEIDSILIKLITPKLKSIDETSDLYALDDKIAVYDYLEHLSFIKDKFETKNELDILNDYITTGTHAEFTNLVREMISTNRR